ncbi:extracellular solute-binding protein [Paenibacillus filicis]|uniref:Extracellular solute-binding protein n=1 Tax=Paenibacillus gyeongsangnamensis TaxID=3388067 RepID=A0ABT4Q5W4_9BACL|nr:extracellular solute-binding protein [Paenibacillus filicis]MCZ8512269.1 extracellular solute-binding protein [Paenibacillus filicis]
MNRKRNGSWSKGLSAVICTGLLLTACSGGGEANKAKDDPKSPGISKDPVTVKFATTQGIFNEAEFKQYVTDPVVKKYPNITVEYINMSTQGSSLNELVSAGTIPDVVVGYGATLKQLKELKLFSNMDPLIKKYQLDLSRIIPQTLEYTKVNSDTDYYGGLPLFNNAFGLFYNKTLFDKFGVPYPKDGMTWEEVGDLGKKLTRVYDGTQYRGFFPDGVNRMINQIELLQLNKDNKSILTTEPWKKAFDLWNYVYNYPGNADAPYNTINFGNNVTAFGKGELAMIAGYSATLLSLRKIPDLNFDIVTYPQHKDHMGYSTNVDTPNFSITEQSKVKDAAFLVLQTMLTDEVQLDLARNAKMSILNNDQVRAEFGKAIPEFQGKNMNLSAMAKLKPSVPKTPKYSTSDTNKIVSDAYESVLKKEKDVNTALRDADEAMNKLVEQKIKLNP